MYQYYGKMETQRGCPLFRGQKCQWEKEGPYHNPSLGSSSEVPPYFFKTYNDLYFLHHGVDVEDGTVACTDDRLVLQDGYLGLKELTHVTGRGGITEDKSGGDVLRVGKE